MAQTPPAPLPAIGACCLPGNSACAIMTRAKCKKRSGAYRGDNLLCIANLCKPTANVHPKPQVANIGACCLSTGKCVVLTAAKCANRGGSFRGDGIVCKAGLCPPANAPAAIPLAGACCSPMGECVVLSAAQCADRSGTYKGNGKACIANLCPNPFNSNQVITTTSPQGGGGGSGGSGGSGGGGGTGGTGGIGGAGGGDRRGACCLASGACAYVTSQECVTQLLGVYRGNNTSCTAVNCAPNTGACCLQDSSCAITDGTWCVSHSGSFAGVNVTCADVGQCISGAPGACCTSDGACVVTNNGHCIAIAGHFRGAGAACSSAACSQPAGACCVTQPFAQCLFLPQSLCTAQAGMWHGASVSCQPALCTPFGPTCACDWNGDGILNTLDLFDYAEAFQSGNADYNHDGATNEADMHDFVGCFINAQNGCG